MVGEYLERDPEMLATFTRRPPDVEDLRRGRLQSDVCSFETSLVVMRRMDEARRQCGLVYPQDS